MQPELMRVLCVVDAIQGRNGVGTYFQDLVDGLTGRVARVELVAPSLDRPHPCQGPSLPMPGDPTQRLFIPRMRELVGVMMDVRPHVVAVPGPGIFSLAGYWIARKMGVSVLVTFQTDYDRLARLYWGPTLARLARVPIDRMNLGMFRGGSAVVTLSESLLAQVRRLGVESPTLVGTPLAREFIATPPAPLPSRIRSVVYVGRLAPEKNVESFLELAERRPDLRFRVVGDGPLRHIVKRRARRTRNLEFLGWRSRREVMAHIDDSEVLILPSSVEAFGTAALEGMARARLVLTTPACGINEWPGLTGGLFAMRAGETLDQALRRIERLPAEARAAFASAARAAALRAHDDAVRQWLSVLGSAARRASARPRPPASPAFALLRRLAQGRSVP